MCGIAGIISRKTLDHSAVLRMMDGLVHRGPDAKGIFTDESHTVALVHTRLSIIDLSTAANQPFYSQDKRYVVVFNGEIYNFKNIRKELESVNSEIRFRTNSDTEVILHAFACWGVELVDRLEGMFAIAICDTILDKLFLFRDRVGKKPLYYFCDYQHFIFASEIKSLLLHPAVAGSKEIDKQAVHEFLHLGYIPEPKTIYRSIRKFPAGSVGEVWSNLSFSFRPYWKAEDQPLEERVSINDSTLKATLREKLHSAVQKRLVSDVPLGSFLSGGTDSSLVTAVASEYTKGPIKTFSIGFKESKFDEHRFAAQVASQLKADHHEYILYESEAVGILETYLDHLDEPFADTSTIPTMLVSKLARKEVTVALTGDGGDELFLGYGAYTWANRFSNPLFKAIQSPLAFGLNTFGGERLKRIAHLLEKVDKQHLRSHIFSQEQYFFSDSEIRNKLLKQTSDYESFRYNDPARVVTLSEEEKQAMFDFNFYLKDDLLVKVDRASMFHGLECRCPLLDQEVIEFAFNAPIQVKRRGGVNKWILKELLKEYLPDSLIHRPKWGFSIPLSRWLKNDLSYLMVYLDDERLEETGVFNPVYIRDMVDRFHKGEYYLYNRLWAVIIVQRFLLSHA